MARVDVTSKGALLDGRWRRTVPVTLRAWLAGVLRRIRDDARAFAPKDTRAFERSIIYRTRVRGFAVEGEVYSTAPTVLQNVIEHGRRPGAKMPPAGALLGWMARHGIPAEREFVVRRAIGERGIPAVRPFGRAYDRSRGLLASQGRILESRLKGALS
jgi:hypothetical protein